MSRNLKLAICVAALLCLAFARFAPDQRGPRYENRALGFRIEGPDFSALGPPGNGNVVVMYGPPSDDFAPNLNVVVQPRQSLADFRRVTFEQFKQAKLEVRAEEKLTVSGCEALLLEYAGAKLGRDLQWLALAVFDRERTYLITCTATPEQFPKLKEAFRTSLNSFGLLEVGRGGPY